VDIITFQAGEILYREGDPSSHALLVESGSVEVLQGGPENPRVVGTVSANEVLGEMGLIDEQPRTHTARAAQAGQAVRVTREEFPMFLATEPLRGLRYLGTLFERIRRLEAEVESLRGGRSAPEGRVGGAFRLLLCPLSRLTAGMLPPEGMVIQKFPFRLGRASEAFEPQSLDLNDLWLLDKTPFEVSRNHLAFELTETGKYLVRDRGSKLGTIVNEQAIGGRSASKTAELTEGDNVVILGPRSSRYQFRAVLEPASP
jgi:CRP-like cAMP-binding protein